MDHLQVMEKVNEYNITLSVVMIHYEKAFDSIEIWTVLNALSNARIDYRHINIIKYIYENATSQIMTTQEKTNKTQSEIRRLYPPNCSHWLWRTCSDI